MLLVIWLIYIYISCCYKLYLVFYSLFLFKKIYRGLFNFDVEKYKYYMVVICWKFLEFYIVEIFYFWNFFKFFMWDILGVMFFWILLGLFVFEFWWCCVEVVVVVEVIFIVSVMCIIVFISCFYMRNKYSKWCKILWKFFGIMIILIYM